MANKRFIDFPIATTVGDNDIILIWQSGANKQTTKATILSGVPDSLNDLTDVTISGLTNGQILRYDSVSGQWENTDQGNLDLNDLNDVTIVSPTNGQVLVYNSSTSKWENSSGGYVPYVGAVTTVNLGAQTIQAGSFVKQGGTSSQFLKADGSVDSTAYGTGSVTSVGLTMPSAFNVANSPITTAGTLAVTGAGTVAQYIRGDGSLADFPESSGGGSSVSYYLNGSVDQGTIGGVAYKEINKVPILGAGTQFSISADGYIASFLTDAGDPNLLEIPGGNWNFETYFSSSSSGGTPTFYVELYKYDGTTFTLIASSVTSPEFIAFGTTLTPYFSTLAVPTTTLALTDRLAVRYYVTHSGRTITLHTENNTLCQIITTFTTGLTALNGLTAQVQNFAVGTTGTDFNIASAVSTHTFNLPTASATNRGALSAADWALFTQAYNDKINSASVTGTTTKTLTLTQQDGGTITASWSDLNTDAVLSVFGRIGNVIAVSGDYTTAQVTESGNLYYTDARSRAALSFAAGSGAYNTSTGVITIPTNNNQIANGAGYITSAALAGYLPLTGGTLTGPLGGTSISLSGDITANRYRGVNSLVLNSYTTVNPSSNVYLYSPPNDRDAWIYLDSADTGSNWGIYHRQIDTASLGLPPNSIGFIGGGSSTLQAWISLQTGNGFFAGSLTASNLSGTNTGNVTIGTGNGLSLSGQVLSLGLASGSVDGALSSTDWTTFNSKQNAGNYVTTDTTQTITGQKTISRVADIFAGTVQSFLIDGAGGNGALTINSISTGYAYQTFAQGGVGKFEIGIVGTSGNGSLYINRTIQTGETGASIYIKKADGFVGINNINPLYQLDINGSTRVFKSGDHWHFVIDGGTGQLRFGAETSGGAIIQARTDGGTTRPIFLQRDGNNVIIGGTNDNGARLQVSGEGRFTNSNGADLIRYAATGINTNFATKIVGGDNDVLVFRRQHSSFGALDIMALGFNGNVGIGTQSPTVFSGNTTLAINNTAGGAVLELQSNGTSAFRMATSASDSALWEPRSVPVLFATANTPRMTITSGGNVLIASNSDNGQAIVQIGGSNNTKLSLKDGSSQNGMRWESVSGANAFYLFNGSFDQTGWGLYNITTATLPLWISNDGNLILNRGASSAGVNTATPKNIRFNNDYSSGYTDASLKIYLYNSGSVIQGFTSGPEFDLQYHSSGSTLGKHVFYVANNRIMTVNNANVLIGTGTDNGGRLNVSGLSILVNPSGSNYNENIRLPEANGGYATIHMGGPVSASGSGVNTWSLLKTSPDFSHRFEIRHNNTPHLILATGGAATFSSSVTATSFFESSDATLKTLIDDNYQAKGIDSVVAKLYIKNGKEELGYFAQDLQSVLPSAVIKGSDGLLNLSYREVHTAKIAYLEEEIRQIKKRYEIN